MRRFDSNRWWTLVLALVLSVASVAAVPSVSSSKGTGGLIGGDPLDGGTIAPPAPQGSGDPDVPTGNGSPQAVVGGGVQSYGTSPVVGVGDTASSEVLVVSWMARVRLVLGSLKGFYLRF